MLAIARAYSVLCVNIIIILNILHNLMNLYAQTNNFQFNERANIHPLKIAAYENHRIASHRIATKLKTIQYTNYTFGFNEMPFHANEMIEKP